MEKIKVNIIGSPGRIRTLSQHTDTLKDSYEVGHKAIVKLSADGEEDNWKVNVKVNNTFLGFIEVYLIKKAYDLLLKELLFQPLYDWLESIDCLDEISPADDLTFEYDDIKIIVAYSRNNHQNAVSQISLNLVKHMSTIRNDEHGKLTTVATPVKLINSDWKFFIPDNSFKLDEYLQHWGLEYNKSHKCIFNLPSEQIVYSHWW